MKATAALALLALAPGCYAHVGAGAIGSRDDSNDGAGFRGMVGAGYYAERARGRVGGGAAGGGVGAGGQRFTLGGAEVFGDVGLGTPSAAGNRWSATGRILAGVVVNPEGEDAADAAQASSAVDLPGELARIVKAVTCTRTASRAVRRRSPTR